MAPLSQPLLTKYYYYSIITTVTRAKALYLQICVIIFVQSYADWLISVSASSRPMAQQYTTS